MSLYYCDRCEGMRAEPSDTDTYRCKVCGTTMGRVNP